VSFSKIGVITYYIILKFLKKDRIINGLGVFGSIECGPKGRNKKGKPLSFFWKKGVVVVILLILLIK
jgi:hypothetical protein